MSYPLEFITYDWLKEHSFHKLERLERQPTDHYRRCLGRELIGDKFLTADEDLCIDVAADRMDDIRSWYVWITKASTQNRHPSIWVHARHMVYTGEIMLLYEGLTGRPFGKFDWDQRKWPAPLFPTPDRHRP